MLVAIFSTPYIASRGSVSLNSLYEVVCIVIIFPLIVWMGASGSTQSKRMSKANQLLGDISYPLYIIHYPIMYIFYAWLIDKEHYSLHTSWPMALLVIASSIVLAILCLKLYDEPVRRWLANKYN